MKPLVILILTIASIPAFAQIRETFDIISFTSPKGWQKEVGQNAVQLGIEDANGNLCLVTMFKAIAASSDAKANFEASWDNIVKGTVTIKGNREDQPTNSKFGWTVNSGIAQYESDGKKGVAILVTATGDKRMVNILALMNSDAYQSQLADLLDSIVLPKVEVTAQTAKPAQQPIAQTNSRLVGKWNRSSSVAPAYADPASWGIAGYTKSRYGFRADGTYVYTERSFSYSNQNILIAKENGKYHVSGNDLTVTPQRSVLEIYSKKGGTDELGNLVKTQNRPLETVTYKFTFHYFSGIQEWNLVLQATAPTNRDGQFSSLTVFPNAWYFDQKFIDTDLTSPRGN